MESWCFDSLDKEYVSNETITPSGSVIRSKDVLIEWDFKAPFSYEDSMLVPSQSVENSGFPEVGLSEIISKQCPPDSPKNVFYTDATVGDIVSPSVVSSDPVSVEEGSSSKVSSSVVDSNSRESSLIDLKLGGFGDNLNCNSSRAAPSSAESSTPAKRGRGTSFGSQTAYCQVYGCKKDLSSAKDYHKRHKVCDVHSKTSKVIVNGIDQRFCQQCSRFHLLGEFDDGKRSCRKRLAGHNERRRKPQVGYYSGRAGRSFSYTGSIGSKFQQTGTPLTTASFICQDILPRGASHAEKSATSGWGAYVKTEDGIDYSQKLSNIYTNGQHQESSVISPLLLGNQYSSVNNTSSNRSQSLLGENVSQIPRELVSRSLVQTNSLGSQDFTLFDAASTVQGLPGISESGCALSLLSSQSQNSSVHPSGIAGAHTFNMPNRSPHYSVSEVSEKLLGVGSQGMTSGNQNRYPLCRNNDAAMPLLSNGDAANSSFSNGILQGSDFVNGNNRLFSEDGTTINLLQLSSQLQRVESQRQPVTGKQDPAIFGSLRMM